MPSVGGRGKRGREGGDGDGDAARWCPRPLTMESKADTKLVMISSFWGKTMFHCSGLELLRVTSRGFPASAIFTWKQEKKGVALLTGALMARAPHGKKMMKVAKKKEREMGVEQALSLLSVLLLLLGPPAPRTHIGMRHHHDARGNRGTARGWGSPRPWPHLSGGAAPHAGG